tara:strand:+ start:48 stop:308 length:261 start_codon:yes stop_codon:yes gene_type:complete
MFKKISIIITSFFLIIQSAKATEINFDEHMSKFKEIIKCIQNETEEIKKYQQKDWIEAKNQNVNNLKKIDRKLDGFFQNLTTRMSN